MTQMQAHEAWAGFVGSQTPAEFMEISRQKLGADTTVEQAVAAYVTSEVASDWPEVDTADLARLLCEYITDKLVV